MQEDCVDVQEIMTHLSCKGNIINPLSKVTVQNLLSCLHGIYIHMFYYALWIKNTSESDPRSYEAT